MAEPKNEWIDDPLEEFYRNGVLDEQERIIKILEETNSTCAYWAIELIKENIAK